MTTKTIDAGTRQTVIQALCEQLESQYVFPEAAKQVAELIQGKHSDGEYDAFEDAEAFAAQLTADVQSVTQDKHLRVRFHEEAKSKEQKQAEAEYQEEYHEFVTRENGGFYKAERLPGNIGYIDLRMFADPAIAGETATAAMNFLANTEALIFDLRKNGGGNPTMVALLTSYLMGSEPVHLNSFYLRPTDSTEQFWTLPYVPGKRFGEHKPVYVLTSNYTFSGAEEFSYNLKNLKRATIIGEVTGGGAHPGGVRQLTEHFAVFVSTGRAINPITKTNWEGTGVLPDIETTAEEAYDLAYTKALEAVLERAENDPKKRRLAEAVQGVLKERAEQTVTA